MQEEGYVVHAFDDCTWSIIDPKTQQVYALGLSVLDNLIIHVFLVELITANLSSRYLAYSREILGCRVEASSLEVARQVTDFILNELHDGENVDNPINIAIRLSADLHGQRVVGRKIDHDHIRFPCSTL
jgi:hypothetical protein